jgi:hypothetical protein
MDTKIDNLIDKMQSARQQLNNALDKITPQVEIYPSWKLKQVMDHITGWDELMLTTLRAYSKGETPGLTVKSGVDKYNAQSVSARKALSFEQSRSAFNAARENVIHLMRELTPEMLGQRYHAPWGGMCTIASIVKIYVSHEQEHAKQIDEILKKSNPDN